MNELIRELFEKHTIPNFGPIDGHPHKNVRGEYQNPAIEDHWQTFQEAAELIMKLCADIALEHTPDTEECNYTWLIHDKIKEHFGVEE